MNISRQAIGSIFFINGFCYASWVARLPRFQDQYGLDNGDLGLVLLAHAVGALIAMPLTGGIIVRFGSNQVTKIGLFTYCLFIPLLPLMPNAVLFALWFGIMGLTTGALDVAMNAQAVEVENEMKKPIMSSFHGLFSAGMIFGAGSGALVNHIELNLSMHLLIVGILVFLLALWSVRFLIKDALHKEKDRIYFTLPDIRLVSIGLIAFCCMLGEGAMADWSTNYLEKIIGASKSFAPLGLAAFSGAMTGGRFIGDWARAKLGDFQLLFLSSLVSILGLSICIFSSHTGIVVFGFFIVGLGLAVIVPIAYSIAGNVDDLPPGLGISMVTTIGYSGFLFGPPIIGFVSDWQSLRIAFIFVLILFALMSLLSFKSGKKQTN